MITLAFDIETQADEARLGDLPPPELKLGNLKDPAKIADKEKDARSKQIASMALDPHFGRVIAIGTLRIEQGAKPIPLTMLRGPDPVNEAHLLAGFWELAAQADQFLTFNGACFDVPFLTRRSLKLGVRPVRIPYGRFHCDDLAGVHVDLFQILSGSETGANIHPHTLAWYVKEILAETSPYPDLDHAEVLGRLFDAGQFDIVRTIAQWDTDVLYRLYRAVAFAYA